jgi:hypothetical protein
LGGGGVGANSSVVAYFYIEAGASNYTGTTVAGSESLTGSVPSIAYQRNFGSVAGSKTITGAVPTLTYARNFTLIAGSKSLTGAVPTLAGALPTITTSYPGPAGSNNRKKRHVVEVDGKQFAVANKREAVELLSQLREVAKEVAAKPIQVAPPLPVIKTEFRIVQPQVEDTQKQIAEMYEAAVKAWFDDEEDALTAIFH